MSSYLVTQATGQQSQAIIAHLLSDGAKVHAVVRNLDRVPDSLKKEGITLFQGESVDLDKITSAAQGCQAAFLNTFPYPGLEAQQARTIVAACEQAGVPHVVASTTFTVNNRALWDDKDTEDVDLLAYFRSKAEVEDIVRGSKTLKSYTIVRPAVIHTDFMFPGVAMNFPSLPSEGKLDTSSDEGVKVLYTDTQDIGRYVSAALRDPVKFGGQEIDLCNENLSAEEVRDILVRVGGGGVGRSIEVKRFEGKEERKKVGETIFGQRFHDWANYKDFGPYEGNAREVESKFGIPLTSLEEALMRDQERVLEVLRG